MIKMIFERIITGMNLTIFDNILERLSIVTQRDKISEFDTHCLEEDVMVG